MRLMLRIVNRNSPPRTPFVLRGKEVIAEYLSAVCGSGARRRIEDQILSNIAWRCTGPASTRTGPELQPRRGWRRVTDGSFGR